MTQSVTGYLLDPLTARISQVYVPRKDSLQALYRLIDCQMVEVYQIDEQHDLWLDEEGWLHRQQAAIAPVPNPNKRMFGGRGVILGHTPDGEIDRPKLEMVEFLHRFVAAQATIRAEFGEASPTELAGAVVFQQTVAFRATVETVRFSIAS